MEEMINMMITTHSLREICANTELFLVRIFLYSDWVRTRNNSIFGHFWRSDCFPKMPESKKGRNTKILIVNSYISFYAKEMYSYSGKLVCEI